MWSLLDYLQRRRQEKRSSSNEDCFWSTVDLPSVSITTSSNASFRRQQHDNDQVCQENNSDIAGESKSMPLLFCLAKTWCFQDVTFRCQTNPEEASSAWVDDQGDNALHWIVHGNPPLNVVEQLLHACPDLACQANKKNELPLHVACSYRASGDVIAALLESFPEAAGMKTGLGSFPLHIVCDYGCSIDTLYRLLQTQAAVPTIHKCDHFYDRRPLDILNGRKNMGKCCQSRETMRKLRRLQQEILKEQQHNVIDPKDAKRVQELEQEIMEYGNSDFWKKAALLILGQHTNRAIVPNNEYKFEGAKVVQAAIANHSCPRSLQEFAILLYQPFLLARDDNGRLPLHVAVSYDARSAAANSGLILDLIEACPEAARVRDAQGRLPLTLAMQNPHLAQTRKGGMRALVEAHPAALAERTLSDLLVWSKFISQNNLFEILRDHPSTLESGGSSEE